MKYPKTKKELFELKALYLCCFCNRVPKEISHIKRPVQRQEPIQMASGVWLKNDKQKVEAFKTHYENQFIMITTTLLT